MEVYWGSYQVSIPQEEVMIIVSLKQQAES